MFSGIVYVVSKSAASSWKFGPIVVVAINIVILRNGIYRSVSECDATIGTPIVTKAAAVTSIVIWIGVEFGGRFLSH
jgi:hypothetical protein